MFPRRQFVQLFSLFLLTFSISVCAIGLQYRPLASPRHPFFLPPCCHCLLNSLHVQRSTASEQLQAHLLSYTDISSCNSAIDAGSLVKVTSPSPSLLRLEPFRACLAQYISL